MWKTYFKDIFKSLVKEKIQGEQIRFLSVPQFKTKISQMEITKVFVQEGEIKQSRAFLAEIQLKKWIIFRQKKILYTKYPCKVDKILIKPGDICNANQILMKLICKISTDVRNTGDINQYDSEFWMGDVDGELGDGGDGDGGDGGD